MSIEWVSPLVRRRVLEDRAPDRLVREQERRAAAALYPSRGKIQGDPPRPLDRPGQRLVGGAQTR